ncbi:VOC family protein [Clostridium sp. Marseille-P2415]|uniref:VOC family protein n=1 Tax=Clostridium sp. Marseille-P2415 TaxID=1805471 RepID=UPI00098884A2|nr:VOC family protein [Clostridium sp. Marseille-P2415]
MEDFNSKELCPIALDAVVLECKDVAVLSDFYIRLLGWEKHYGEDGEWADIISPSGGVKIAFQKNEAYVPPVWPDEPGAQQQMVHLDFTVNGKEQMGLAVQKAISCGAVKASVQYDSEKWTTMLDPAGHPFCFVIW